MPSRADGFPCGRPTREGGRAAACAGAVELLHELERDERTVSRLSGCRRAGHRRQHRHRHGRDRPMNRALLTFVVVLLAAGSARADIPPLRPFVKHANVSHHIELTEPAPDHVFVVVRSSFQRQLASEAAFVDLAPGRPLTLTTGYHESPELIIVPKTVAERYKTPRELIEAVRDHQIPGVARQQCHWREEVPEWTAKELTVTYRVQRIQSGGGLEVVRASRGPMWQWYMAAGFFSVAVVIGGLRFVRWWFRPVRTQPFA